MLYEGILLKQLLELLRSNEVVFPAVNLAWTRVTSGICGDLVRQEAA